MTVEKLIEMYKAEIKSTKDIILDIKESLKGGNLKESDIEECIESLRVLKQAKFFYKRTIKYLKSI